MTEHLHKYSIPVLSLRTYSVQNCVPGADGSVDMSMTESLSLGFPSDGRNAHLVFL